LRIVIHPAVDADRLDALRRAAGSTPVEWVNAASPAEALAAIADADALLGKVTPELLARAGRLRWVQAFTAGLEHYMFPALVDHPCTLSNMRGLFGDVIADQVMGYVLCFARNLHTYIHQQAERRYEPAGGEAARVDNAAGPGTVGAMDRATIFLPDATLGIVGLGGIGTEVARRALTFGMTVRAVDRFPGRARPPEGVEVDGLDDLPDLLSESDFVVVAAPETPETARLFDAARIALMKPTAYLINVGRGAIVRLGDLVEALEAGTIAGAALDVFEVEPLPPDHPLWGFPNVIITPHTAGYSPVIARRHLETLAENVGRFARGEPLLNVVDKRLWF
jgi:phosphoglycerate dehydrogenase-like enzyme